MSNVNEIGKLYYNSDREVAFQPVLLSNVDDNPIDDPSVFEFEEPEIEDGMRSNIRNHLYQIIRNIH